MDGPVSGRTFQSLTSLSAEPVTRKPGMMGETSKEEMVSSWAWRRQAVREGLVELEGGAVRASK